jgi:hypothetical protein
MPIRALTALTYLPNTANSDNLDDLWWLMHHSDDPSRRSAAITCYCDDGGSDKSDLAMIGGLVMNRDRFKRLDAGWRKMLCDYRLNSIHMADFVRPNGRYVGMYPEMKTALFRSVAQLIHRNRAYSIVMSIPLGDFKELV